MLHYVIFCNFWALSISCFLYKLWNHWRLESESNSTQNLDYMPITVLYFLNIVFKYFPYTLGNNNVSLLLYLALNGKKRAEWIYKKQQIGAMHSGLCHKTTGCVFMFLLTYPNIGRAYSAHSACAWQGVCVLHRPGCAGVWNSREKH